jgi:hypothetical protein
MNKTTPNLGREIHNDLQQVLEPLVSYIAASERPKAMLASALAALFSEVGQTNRAAIAHLAAFSGNSWL